MAETQLTKNPVDDAGQPNRFPEKLIVLSLLLAFVVVVVGAYTRLVDAGLGCPDWPGCYGYLVVPDTEQEIATAQARFPDTPVEADKAWPEMVHRYLASTLGLFIVLVAVFAVRNRAAHTPVKLPLLLVALVLLQGAFGAWTVTLKLWPQVVTAHLLGGFATLSLLWLLHLRTTPWLSKPGWRVPTRYYSHAMLALIVVVVQVAIGGWVSSNYAALACADFPTCHGQWWPSMNIARGFDIGQSVGPNYLGGQLDSDARTAIQIAHRLGALLVLFVAGSLSFRLIKQGARWGYLLAGVLAVQLTLGVLNIVWVLPLWSAVSHNAFGALTTAVLVAVNYAAVREVHHV